MTLINRGQPTDGPWYVEHQLNGFRQGLMNIVDGDGNTVFHAGRSDNPESVGNAHLGAAAPKMLEALKLCLPLMQHRASFGENTAVLAYGTLVSAIAKAEGK